MMKIKQYLSELCVKLKRQNNNNALDKCIAFHFIGPENSVNFTVTAASRVRVSSKKCMDQKVISYAVKSEEQEIQQNESIVAFERLETDTAVRAKHRPHLRYPMQVIALLRQYQDNTLDVLPTNYTDLLFEQRIMNKCTYLDATKWSLCVCVRACVQLKMENGHLPLDYCAMQLFWI